MEKEVIAHSKTDLEDKFNSLTQKYTQVSKELDQLRKPPVTAKPKDTTKTLIKDLMKSNLLTKNVSNSNLNKENRGSFVLSDNKDEGSTNNDSTNLEESSLDNNRLLGSNTSKRLTNIGKSPKSKNKFRLNLFSDDK